MRAKGIKEAMGKKALIQRCHWHKRENVVSYLNKKNVDRWQNSIQRQRWVATAMLSFEPRLRNVKGFKFLGELRDVMKHEVNIN
jgi:hypothetical protein